MTTTTTNQLLERIAVALESLASRGSKRLVPAIGSQPANTIAYHQQQGAGEALTKMFRPATSKDAAAQYLTTVEIQVALESELSHRLNTKALGQALRAAGFIRRSKRIAGHTRHRYAVVKMSFV